MFVICSGGHQAYVHVLTHSFPAVCASHVCRMDNLGGGPINHYYCCLPFHRSSGLLMQFGAALIAGATSTVRERFSASSWLADISASRATITHSLGAISAFVASHPPTPADRDHCLRLIKIGRAHV